jgi:hypothetical protein
MHLRRKRIDPNDAQPTGLRAALAFPPDQEDKMAHIMTEFCKWLGAWLRHFGMTDRGGDRIEIGMKLMLAIEFDIDPTRSDWREALVAKLMSKRFATIIKRPNKKKAGAPLEWTDQQYCKLFADIEYLKKVTGKSVREICKDLPKRRGYVKRWGRYRAPGLRKAYAEANRRRRGLLFRLQLCGDKRTNPIGCRDSIGAAISIHALKC